MEQIGTDQSSMSVNNYEFEGSESESSEGESSNRHSSGSARFEGFTKIGMYRVEEGTQKYRDLEKTAIKEMGLSGIHSKVVAIHGTTCSTMSMQVRMEAFQIFSEAVANKCGGNANITYAWYVGSRDDITQVITYGFSGCKQPADNSGECHGIGIYLIPRNTPTDWALAAPEDENGLRHVILCRVILGNTEVIPAGSKQYQPSCGHFDSGVDNRFAPTKYIIWRPYMNSHIYPSYVFSFKHLCPIGSQSVRDPPLKPNSPYMQFPILIRLLSKVLDPSKLNSINKCYSDFLRKRITRAQLIQSVRQIAGDNLLKKVIILTKDKFFTAGR